MEFSAQKLSKTHVILPFTLLTPTRWSSQGENGRVESGKPMGFKIIVGEVQSLPDEDDAK